MTNYIDEAIWIYELILDRYTDNDGMLVYRVNSITGEIVDHNILVSDFGDYIQNFYYLGMISGREDICKWSLQHIIKAAEIYQDGSGFFLTHKGKNYLSIAENADTFEGLSTLYHLSSEPQILAILKKFIQGIEKKCDQNGYIPQKFYGPLNWPIAGSDYTGNFIEELGLLFEKSGENKFRELAKELTFPWVNGDYFNTIGLIQHRVIRPSFFLPLIKMVCEFKGESFLNSRLVKSNTNFISGVLQLWKTGLETDEKHLYKKIIDQWKNGVEMHCAKNGYYFGKYDARKNQRGEYHRPLPDNHHVLAAYADIYFFCKDHEYLSLLRKGCDFWIQYQKETGLFPESPLQNGNNSKRAIMDGNLDLSIVLLKTHSLTGDIKYFDSAKNCIDAIIKYFKKDFGYNEIVEVETGELLEHGRMYTKYMTLFIKGLLIVDQILQGKDIYSEELFLISRDR